MTRLEALKDLKAKVEAGEFPGAMDGAARMVWPYNQREADDLGLTAALAFDGSLDAAKALHEVVLPGYAWQVCQETKSVAQVAHADAMYFEEPFVSYTPARAWLLAILSALIKQEETQCR
jgi:hypothetical protein